uniref:Uncharacterized protein n=1 Tax=Anguilla anguilla TaxID=7936 RepID=A0A0E9Q6Y0_ANGAN
MLFYSLFSRRAVGLFFTCQIKI